MPFEITTTRAQLQLRTTQPQITIQQPKGELSIKQHKPEIIIDRDPVQVIIDQYQCFAEAGLKNNTDLSKEFENLGRIKALEGIAKRVSEGNRMGTIESRNFNVIPQLAKQSSVRELKEFNYDVIPKSRPKIDFKGDLQINWNINKPDINYTPQRPKISATRGKLEGYLDPYPDIDIKYIDERR